MVELLDELKRKDMAEMVHYFRPSKAATVVKGILSNLPLPIPFNPFSAGQAVADVLRDQRVGDRFGWLYFLMDLEGKRK
jgi:hypothetical protein